MADNSTATGAAGRTLDRHALRASTLGLALALAACGGGGGGTAGSSPGATVQPELQAVEYGRLVDVYGLQVTAQGSSSRCPTVSSERLSTSICHLLGSTPLVWPFFPRIRKRRARP